jgi:hypothetical protein
MLVVKFRRDFSWRRLMLRRKGEIANDPGRK